MPSALNTSNKENVSMHTICIVNFITNWPVFKNERYQAANLLNFAESPRRYGIFRTQPRLEQKLLVHAAQP